MYELDNAWCKYHNEILEKKVITVDFDISDFSSLVPDPDEFLKYRTQAALEVASVSGNKLALSVSGGADSQAMVQSFVEADIDFDIVTLKFKDDLNLHDIEFARATADRYGKSLRYVELDVMRFLYNDLEKYADRYHCPSPQFACHHWFSEQLIELGYTGIVQGGDPWTPKENGRWLHGVSTARLSWINFAKINQFPLQGNFLGSTWQLAFSLGACYNITVDALAEARRNPNNRGEILRLAGVAIYEEKLNAYRRYGFNIMPQAYKYTGFEKVKQYFIDKRNDPWAFERRFRNTLERKFLNRVAEVVLTEQQIQGLAALHQRFSTIRT